MLACVQCSLCLHSLCACFAQSLHALIVVLLLIYCLQFEVGFPNLIPSFTQGISGTITPLKSPPPLRCIFWSIKQNLECDSQSQQLTLNRVFYRIWNLFAFCGSSIYFVLFCEIFVLDCTYIYVCVCFPHF